MKQLSRFINSTTILVITMIGVILLSFSLILYYQRYYLDQESVFWETISNNLSTSSITRYQQDKQLGSLSVDEQNTFVFRPELGLSSRVTFEGRLAPNPDSVVIQDVEALGFSDGDFLRYLEVNSDDEGFDEKFESFISGNWLVVEQTTTEQPEAVVELLTDNLIDNHGHSLILYGSLPREVRLEIMEIVRSGGYQVDFDNVRHQDVDGRLIYEYDLTVDLAYFDQAVVSYLQSYGYHELAEQVRLTVALAATPPKIDLIVQIDARARQVVKITNESGVEEYLTAQGVNQTLTRPEAELSTRQLEALISN